MAENTDFLLLPPPNDLRSALNFVDICDTLRSTKSGWLFPCNSRASKAIIQKHEKSTYPKKLNSFFVLGSKKF